MIAMPVAAAPIAAPVSAPIMVRRVTREGAAGKDAGSPNASSSSMRASPMSRNRLCGSFRRQRRSNDTTDDGVAAGSACQSGSRSTVAAMISPSVSPRNAVLPVSISYRTQPNAQMSVRVSTGFPHACSGDM
jgi:hypothetical protein